MTTPARRPIIGGNWKMNLTRAGALELAEAGAKRAAASGVLERVDMVMYPPFVHLHVVGEALRSAGARVILGAQDFYPEKPGAVTGEIAIEQLIDLGVTAALVGHSERRHVIGEPEELIRRKTIAALGAGLLTTLCVGETLAQREKGETDGVNERQLRSALEGAPGVADPAKLVIAYEPVWAIGTGRNATPGDAQSAQARIRSVLGSLLGAGAAGAIRIQYGGSLKPDNAREIFAQPDVDGGLIGGASLKAGDFLAICEAATGQ